MARTRQLLEMRDDAYKRADEENNTARFPTDEVDRYVNQGIAAVYDLLVDARGQEYYEATPADTVMTTAQTYPLPSTFYQLIKARIIVGVRQSWDLEPFTNAEESIIEDAQTASGPLYYQLRAGNIYVSPIPTAGLTLRIRYVPASPVIPSSPGTGTFDGINGWEEYAVLYAAKCMATKNAEWDTVQALSAELAAMQQRIKGLAYRRDRGHPERIQDVRGERFHRRWRHWRA